MNTYHRRLARAGQEERLLLHKRGHVVVLAFLKVLLQRNGLRVEDQIGQLLVDTHALLSLLALRFPERERGKRRDTCVGTSK
jgi:hypothetical protein